MPIKVLIVDDSAVVRQVLSKGLEGDPAIEVVGVAPDPYVARDKIVKLKPDVLTLDVEMPRMDGIEFLRKLLPQAPMPVVMVSSMTDKGAHATLEALEAGAVDFVTKPGGQFGGKGLETLMGELRTKIKMAYKARSAVARRFRNKPKPIIRAPLEGRVLKGTTDKVIAIGASTGGTEALREVVTHFPANMPGTVVVQHMPEKFTAMYAERLNSLSAVEVKEAVDGDRVMPGRVLLAAGGYHMRVIRKGGQYRVSCRPGERVSGHCPSVDVLFQSVAKDVGSNAIGVILTGMGDDGARGLLAMKQAGAHTIAQDEASCVVFGMPKEAIKLGAVDQILPLSQIAATVLRCVDA